MKIISTEKAPKAVGPYSQAVLKNGVLYASGQIAINPQNQTLVNGDIEAQTEQIIKNISEVLKAANMNFENVVKTTCFLAEIADFAKFNSIYEKYFISKPARSCVAVKDLPKGALAEIEIIAVE
ncbi:MAG: RidA family protein [Candidatus Gastranaerophilaceae bacterium]